MNITIHASGNGKRIRVHDRISGTDPLNDFLAPDESRPIDIASNDGAAGDIDVVAQMRADSVWVNVKTDYAARADEVIDVDDV
jgi:hypothetical protein